jgi:hypothetical protein
MSPRSLTTHADTQEFRRLFAKSSEVDKPLQRALRRNIRVAAEVLADAPRLAVMNSAGGTVSAKPQNKGLRLGIASGIKVKVMTGARAGVAIVAGTSQMPAGMETLVRAWEARKGWRHPIFGRKGKGDWKEQQGHPYFAQPIFAGRGVVTKAVEAAMIEAAESLK